MIYMTKEVKEALRELANRNGREHYEIAVINEVVNAFRNNTDCILKADVLEILKVRFPQAKYRTREDSPNHLPEHQEDEADNWQFRRFFKVARSYRGAIKHLQDLSGISQSTISTMLSREKIPMEKYKQLEPHFKTVLKVSGV